MDDLRVPTVQVSTELHCADGVVLRGIVFMPALSAVQAGPMRPEEWVNGPRPFFPFKPAGASSAILLNKDQLLAMVVEAMPVPDDPTWDELTGSALRVAVEAGGKRFEGDLILDMPDNRQRLVDFLNRPGAFVSLTVDGRVVLIRKDRIARAHEVLS